MTEPIKPTVLNDEQPKVQTEVKFTINQDMIVDGCIEKAIRPVQGEIDKLNVDLNVVEKNFNDAWEMANAMAKAQGHQAAEPIVADAKKFFSHFIHKTERVYVYIDPTLGPSYDEGNGQYRQAIYIRVKAIAVAAAMSDDDALKAYMSRSRSNSSYRDLTMDLQHTIEVPTEVSLVIDRAIKLGDDVKKITEAIKLKRAEIGQIQKRRGAMLAELNAQLLAESPHGAAVMKTLGSILSQPLPALTAADLRDEDNE